MNFSIFKKFNKLLLSAVLILILIAVYFIFHSSDPAEQNLTLEEASEIGETERYELLVQIEEPKGKSEDLKGRYQRGDIVMATPGEKEWSPAETEGFLILKIDLTSKQAEILMRSMEQETEKKSEDGEKMTEILGRRRYAVDLEKIGINAGEMRKGKIEEVWKWEGVILDKK